MPQNPDLIATKVRVHSSITISFLNIYSHHLSPSPFVINNPAGTGDEPGQTVSGQVFVFDRTKHTSEPERGGLCRPDLKLTGQTKEGYALQHMFSPLPHPLKTLVNSFPRFGLAWNPVKAGAILAASEDMTVCQWYVIP